MTGMGWVEIGVGKVMAVKGILYVIGQWFGLDEHTAFTGRDFFLAKLLRLIYGNTSSKSGQCALFIAFHAGP